MLRKFKKQNIQGFTLLEIAITMTILSVLMIFAMQAYTKYRVDQVRRITTENVSAANTKVVEFLSLNARYPCPAVLGVERNDPNYGLEGDCTVAAPALGACDGTTAICREEGAREIETSPGVFERLAVRRGALPFRSLNMPEEMAYDGYGNRIQYAVTEELTATANYDPNNGTIEILDATGVSVLSQPGTAQFMVMSSGSNGVGAYTMDGQLVEDCTGATSDTENCNTSLVNNRSVYRAMAHNFTAADYYDDVVAYDTASEAPAWQFTDADNINARQIEDDDVLLNDDEATAKEGARIDVGGNIKVEGQVRAGRICTDNVERSTPGAEDCFETDKIAGLIADGGGMQCPAGQVLTGIENSAPICKPVLSVGGCPEGTLLKGVDSDLSPICEGPPVFCPAYTRTHCGETKTYQATTAGNNTVRRHDFGYSYYRQYRCRDNGTWQYAGAGGHCSCSPGTYTQNYSCGTGYTGRRYREVTTVCDPVTGVNRTYGSWDRSDCECVGASREYTTSCPSGMSGQRTRDRTLDCDTGIWSYGPWSTVEDSCTCVAPDPQTRTVSCDAGMIGVKHQYRNYDCDTLSWESTWHTDVSKTTCRCEAGEKQTKSASDCPDGYVGTVYYEREATCSPTPAWSDWTETSNTCRLQVCVWRPVSSSTNGPFGTGAGGVGNPCTCGRANAGCYLQKGASSFDNYAECACELDD